MSRRDIPKNPLPNRYNAPRPGKTRPHTVPLTLMELHTGARLAGGDLTKNIGAHARDQPSFAAAGARNRSKAVDSLDLDNFLHPK